MRPGEIIFFTPVSRIGAIFCTCPGAILAGYVWASFIVEKCVVLFLRIQRLSQSEKVFHFHGHWYVNLTSIPLEMLCTSVHIVINSGWHTMGIHYLLKLRYLPFCRKINHYLSSCMFYGNFIFHFQVDLAMRRIHDRKNMGKIILSTVRPPVNRNK